MRVLLILLFLFGTLSQARAATDWALVHTRTMEAMDLLYNLDFVAAEKKCNEVIGLAPGDPRGHFFKAMTYYYKMSFKGGSKNDTAFWAFVYHADKVKQVCERLLDQNEQDTKAMFYLGGTIGFKGLAYVGRGETMKAIWDGKKGYDLLADAVAIDPTNMDAKMGLGMFQYMISQAPSALQPAIKLAGMSGDRWGGLRMLEEAAAKGTYAKSEARRWLSSFYLDEDLPKRAIVHLRIVKEAFPNNWYVLQQFADVTCFQLFDAKAAEDAYKLMATMDVKTGDDAYVRWVANTRLGYLSTARERYEEAISYYTTAYNVTSSSDRKNESASNLGLAYELMGDRRVATMWYQKAGASPMAQKNLARAWTAEDIVTNKIAWAYSIGLYSRVAFLADSARNHGMIPAIPKYAQVLYQQGVACSELSRYSDADQCFRDILGIQGTDPWVPPAKALEFEDYPSEVTLRKRIAREKSALDRNGK
ncbi:MAG: DUF3808 domain-containing protein [Candidatus Kapabacteria bacterium]|nr:DUF3808 domain-containing protein [Candidatus Kapabacteria bacterium]